MDIYEHRGYKDFVWNVKMHQFGMELIGLWPKINEVAKESFASDFRMAVTFVIVAILNVIPFICSLIRVWGDMILMIDNLQVTLSIAVASIKLVNMRWKQAVFLTVVKMMAEDWMKLKEDAEREVMVRRARIARLIVICGYVALIIFMIMVIVLPSFGLPFRYITNLTDGDRLLPLQAYYFYDTDESPQYELTLIVQIAGTFLATLTYLLIDAFLGLVVFHICGQLENFRNQLANLVLRKDFDRALRDNIETHIRLIRFADNIDDMFNLIMLGIVFYCAVIFCLYAFILFTVFTDNEINIPISRIGFTIFGNIFVLLNTWLYCFAGEIIADQCDAVYHTICDLEWYKLESRNQRILILLMLRAREPFRITAGKMIPLRMTTFCSVLKTSAGYVSFLMTQRG